MKPILILMIVCSFAFSQIENIDCNKIDTISISKTRMIAIEYSCNKLYKEYYIDTLVNGKQNGLSLGFYYNGSKAAKSYYSQGKLNGLSIRWYQNGSIMDSAWYLNDKKTGTTKFWSEKGILTELRSYDSFGKRNGLSQSWYEGGKPKDSIIYKDGAPTEEHEFYINGKLKHSMFFSRPDFIITGKFFDIKGKKTGEIVNGNGKAPRYDDDGMLLKVWEVKNGKFVE